VIPCRHDHDGIFVSTAVMGLSRPSGTSEYHPPHFFYRCMVPPGLEFRMADRFFGVI
jgi:hypothetical protein